MALTLDQLKSGGKVQMAQALARMEAAPDDLAMVALLDEAFARPFGQVIGLTGPPGVGKSTLIGALIRDYRLRGKAIGVIAVDPSSRRSGGALLGDRTRLRTDPEDNGIFVRSMAARDQLGGLAEMTYAAMILMRAVFDIVLVETVGVGQSETDIAMAADTVVFCVQPGSGDSLQFMKAGIVEIPDIVVVTKGDMGKAATRAKTDVKGALSLALTDPEAWPIAVLTVSATSGEGIARLIDSAADHFAWLQANARLDIQRHNQAEAWLKQAIKERYGREGLKRLGALSLSPGTSPFGKLAPQEG
ncbi:ArgK/MeaB family GTPase [Dongia soli]|uniref:GTP-binding protein n=1 Tax=Dongia soli TaxID=600628 RepID=A0ABU5EDH5_9PROT|nr:GTP-binding protein [Dongia soli]MDY0883503.1 GTP-binding protein [Dongia soli]